MLLEEVINEQTINLELEVETKTEAIEKLAGMLCEADRITEKKAFLNNIFEREKTESTDMGIGVAIPHGKSNSVEQASVAIGRVKEPFFWNETEEEQAEPVFAIFLLASPLQAEGNTHLELISKIASLLIEEEFVQLLRTTSDKALLLNSIRSYIGDM